MTAPAGAGGAGGTGRTSPTPPADPVDTNPRRQRPEGMAMTDFLIEIGSQHRPAPEDIGLIYRVNKEQQAQMALELGDITQVGTTTPPTPPEGEEEGAAAAAPEGYPIYQFEGAEGNDTLRFTLDPRYIDIMGPSSPPYIPHEPGQVHSDMECALWGGYRYDHPIPEDIHQKYDDLQTGIRVRYSGDNAQLVSSDDESDDEDGS